VLSTGNNTVLLSGMVDNSDPSLRPHSCVFLPGFGIQCSLLVVYAALPRPEPGAGATVLVRTPHPHAVAIGSGGSGSSSTSRTVQQRPVRPAAMAGVRWR
jgi:hypothetical protein